MAVVVVLARREGQDFWRRERGSGFVPGGLITLSVIGIHG